MIDSEIIEQFIESMQNMLEELDTTLWNNECSDENMIFNFKHFIEYLKNNNCMNEHLEKNINDYMRFYNKLGE